MTDHSKPVALIGLGVMGHAIAERLVGAGHDVRVYDVTADAKARAESAGCVFRESPAAAAHDAHTALLSLPGPQHVRDVVHDGADNLLGCMQPGTVIVDTSTVSPQSSRVNAADAARAGVGYIDSPVLGRPAAAGAWTLPVGGDEAHLASVEPILRTLAANIVHVGDVGAGNTVKLLNNLMFGAINSITCEVFALGEVLGIDTELFYRTVADSGAATVSNLFRDLGEKIITDDFTAVFSVDNLRKDVSLGVTMAREAGVELMISEQNLKQIELARDSGLGTEDTAAIVRFCRSTMAHHTGD